MNDNEDFSHQAILIEELLAAPFVAATNANPNGTRTSKVFNRNLF
jgi:hypothetical protein